MSEKDIEELAIKYDGHKVSRGEVRREVLTAGENIKYVLESGLKKKAKKILSYIRK